MRNQLLQSYRTATLKQSKTGAICKVSFLRCMTSGNDFPKLTKSDEVKLHSVQHFAVEKTPITAQLWMQRMKGRDDLVASTSSTQTANSYSSNGASKAEEVAPTFLLDKNSKESRLTIRYNFSQDGVLHIVACGVVSLLHQQLTISCMTVDPLFFM